MTGNSFGEETEKQDDNYMEQKLFSSYYGSGHHWSYEVMKDSETNNKIISQK